MEHAKRDIKIWRGVYEFGRNIEVHWEALPDQFKCELIFQWGMQTIRVRIPIVKRDGSSP